MEFLLYALVHTHEQDSGRLVFTICTIFTAKTYDIYTYMQIQQPSNVYVLAATSIVFAY